MTDAPNIDKSALRDAATVIVLRDRGHAPSILMGQRGAKAAFMPNKFVFPGGAVDPEDAHVPFANPLSPLCTSRLLDDAPPDCAPALAGAAIRELWKKPDRFSAHPGNGTANRGDWRDFAAKGHLPNAAPLQFVFRAITPPGRPRRFDARFFLLDANDLGTRPGRFLGGLGRIGASAMDRAGQGTRASTCPSSPKSCWPRSQPAPADRAPPASVPFFRNDDEESLFLRLHGKPLPD